MKRVFILLIFTISGFSTFCQVPGKMEMGRLDLRDWDGNKQSVISLDGEWLFQWEKLLTWDDLIIGKKTYAEFSTPWNEQFVNGSKPSNNGYATYGAEVILPLGMDEISIQVPAFFNSYSLWINDMLICSNGTVGVSKEKEVPEWRPQSVSVKLQSNIVHMVIHISNFQDTRGGATQAVKISSGTTLISAEARDKVTGPIMFLVFLTVGVVCIMIYYLSRQPNVLYFSMVSIAFAIRFLFSDMYLYYDLLPFDIPWDLAVRFEYATIPFIVGWSTLFVSGQYPHEFKRPVRVFFILTSVLFFVLTTLIGFEFISQLLLFSQVTTLAFLVYAIIAIINAMLNNRVGAWTSAIGLALCVSVGFYNIAILLSGGEINRLIIYGFL